jgi:anti-sigma B factor antagonist
MSNDEIPITETPNFKGSMESRGTSSVVRAVGDIDIASAPALAAQIEAAIGTGPSRLIIDMSGVTMLDSSGLGVLITTMKRLESDGGATSLQLVVSEPHVRKVFAVTGLDNVFSFLEPGALPPTID